jgi:hypothetical protein
VTIQTKQYVELSDIVSIRVECNKCRTALCFEMPKEFNTGSLVTCPNCNAWWAAAPNSASVEPAIARFLSAFRELNDSIKTKKQTGTIGFALLLEIEQEAETNSSASDRASSDRV